MHMQHEYFSMWSFCGLLLIDSCKHLNVMRHLIPVWPPFCVCPLPSPSADIFKREDYNHAGVSFPTMPHSSYCSLYHRLNGKQFFWLKTAIYTARPACVCANKRFNCQYPWYTACSETFQQSAWAQLAEYSRPTTCTPQLMTWSRTF